MRKLTETEHTFLALIGSVGGSFIPSDDADPSAFELLRSLVKAKCLTVEECDLPQGRYHLTAKGRGALE